jgi:hypothetical protein
MKKNHPIPEEYQKLFAVGELDRRGNIIDFKTPPIIIDSPLPINQYKEKVFREHTSINKIPLVYTQEIKRFIILRPTALCYQTYVREELIRSGLFIHEEFYIDNFMHLADVLYLLDSNISFHWNWRIIMRTLHDTNTQNQDKAIVFLLENKGNIDNVMEIKKDIRSHLGEIPVLVRYDNISEIALGIHHLHSPDLEHLSTEYNALMHAKNKTSIFAPI